MRQARSGLTPLVDQRVDVTRVGFRTESPRLCGERHFGVVELRHGPDMPTTVHYDLLPLERGIEVRDDARPPVTVLGQHERLRRRHFLVARAEGTRFELAGRRRLERGARCA